MSQVTQEQLELIDVLKDIQESIKLIRQLLKKQQLDIENLAREIQDHKNNFAMHK